MHRFGQIRTSIFFVFFTSKNSVNSFRYTVSAFLHAYPSLSLKRYCGFLFPIFCDEHMQIHSDQYPIFRHCYTEKCLLIVKDIVSLYPYTSRTLVKVFQSFATHLVVDSYLPVAYVCRYPYSSFSLVTVCC